MILDTSVSKTRSSDQSYYPFCGILGQTMDYDSVQGFIENHWNEEQMSQLEKTCGMLCGGRKQQSEPNF